jgi:hypothetical protein
MCQQCTRILNLGREIITGKYTDFFFCKTTGFDFKEIIKLQLIYNYCTLAYLTVLPNFGTYTTLKELGREGRRGTY